MTAEDHDAGEVGFAELVTAAERLADRGGRRVLGLAGPPGAGKSTLAQRLVARLGERAAYVGMDGFHLAQRELDRLGRAERKGAPDTFDPAGYAELLARLRRGGPDVVYAPEFRRDLEEPIACAVPVGPDTALVVTEGNYLLLDTPAWRPVRALLDEVWFLDPPAGLRLARLVDRHVAHGRTRLQARERAHGSDAANAVLVAATRASADRVFGGVRRN